MGFCRFTWFICLLFSAVQLAHGGVLDRLETALCQAGFTCTVNHSLFQALLEDETGSVVVPETEMMLKAASMEAHGDFLPKVRRLSKIFIDETSRLFAESKYQQGLDNVHAWFLLSFRFSDLQEMLAIPMLSVLYPLLATKDFPDRVRVEFCRICQKTLPPLNPATRKLQRLHIPPQ